MSILNGLRRLWRPEAKSAGAVVVGLGAAVWSGRDYAALARRGYMENGIVYRCVSLIAQCAGSVPLIATRGGRELPAGHPVVAALRRPNPMQSGAGLRSALHSGWRLAGEAFLLRLVSPGGAMEWHVVRPDRVRLVPGAGGVPQRYEILAGPGSAGRAVPVDPVGGQCDLLRLSGWHPLEDWGGLSPLQPALYALDQHAEASRWNKTLLQNGGRPAGVLKSKGNLTEGQVRQLRDMLAEFRSGRDRFHDTMVLEADLDYQEIGYSAQDVEFLEGRRDAGREIANAFGVPPMLLGIPGDNTYSNQQEARAALWEDTVIPLVSAEAEALAAWLEPLHPGITLTPDWDSVPALQYRRDRVWRMAAEAGGFLTRNEQRAMLGYAPLDGGDRIGGER